MIEWILLTIILLLSIMHLILNCNKTMRLIRKIPGPTEQFLVGNALEFFVTPGYIPVELFNLARKYAKTFKGIYGFWTILIRTVNIYNPGDIEIILSGMKHDEKGLTYNILKPWLRDGLLLSSGLKWHQRRKILTPAFHYNILRQFSTVLEENSGRLVEALQKTQGEPVDIVPLISGYTLNGICETAMGTRLHEDETGAGISYKNAVHMLGLSLVDRVSKLWAISDFLFNLTLEGLKIRKQLDIVHSFTQKVIKERTDYVEKYGIQFEENEDDEYFSSKKKRIAMLDLLISNEKEGIIDRGGIQEEVDTFMFEGHDTTASGLNCCFMELANNKDIQDKIVSELQEIFGDSSRLATLDDLSSMRYLDCCIKESLRLYPPVPLIARKLSETVTLSNYTVPESTHCYIHIYDLHRREDLYENPLVFDPDRFLPENSVGRHPYAYIPFSAGPRNCIGQKFAMLEMKSCVATVLRKFELRPVTEPTDMQFMADLVLRSAKPVYVKFVERNK